MTTNQIVVRLVIGSWCLLTLVMLNVYNGTLTSYVTRVHRAEPIVQSLKDIIDDSSNVRLIVDRSAAFDAKFSVSSKFKLRSLILSYSFIFSSNEHHSIVRCVTVYFSTLDSICCRDEQNTWDQTAVLPEIAL